MASTVQMAFEMNFCELNVINIDKNFINDCSQEFIR